ncbi:MAG: sensor histidine kinase, partial [Verrucomicrobiota bacterium]
AWEIVVIDEGRGMPEAEQAKLFQPFFRASNTGTVAGTGLGLTIVQRVVDRHGGRVDFRSREGAGTTVRLAFPAAPAAPTL